MHEMQIIVIPMFAVSVSRGSIRLHCAKTSEQIKNLFGVNTLGAQGTLC